MASVDDSIEYASTIVGNFNDAAAAKEAAAAQISAGADMIFALLDAGFTGVEQAVTESGKDILLMNPIFPRCDEGDNIVGVAFLSSGGLVDQIIQDYQNDALPTPDPKFYGVENPDIQRFACAMGSPVPGPGGPDHGRDQRREHHPAGRHLRFHGLGAWRTTAASSLETASRKGDRGPAGAGPQ